MLTDYIEPVHDVVRVLFRLAIRGIRASRSIVVSINLSLKMLRLRIDAILSPATERDPRPVPPAARATRWLAEAGSCRDRIGAHAFAGYARRDG